MAYVRPATVKDAVDLCPYLRPADRHEIISSTGVNPEVILPMSVGLSTGKVYSIFSKTHEIGGLFGVRPILNHPEIGLIWLVMSDRFLTNRADKIQFLRESPEWIREFHETYPILGNYAHAGNDLHLRWLKWMGFVLMQKKDPWGARGEAFYQFTRIRDV